MTRRVGIRHLDKTEAAAILQAPPAVGSDGLTVSSSGLERAGHLLSVGCFVRAEVSRLWNCGPNSEKMIRVLKTTMLAAGGC